MQIKAADDPQPTIDALEALARRPDVDGTTRRRIGQEIRQIRAGASGEREAAYEIEFYCGPSKNQMTLHDLRIEVEGRVAQIDHLIINRLLDMWVCESKHFAEGVAINEQGEWDAFYGGRRQGIGSPVEQNRKHIAVLSDVFAKGIVRLPTRLGLAIKPQFRSLILVSSRARIARPKRGAYIEGLETVIKVDQLLPTLDRQYEEHSVAALRKVIGQGTLEGLARDLAALHVPAFTDWSARFGLPSVPAVAQPSEASSRSRDAQVAAVVPSTGTAAAPRPVCASCGRRVSSAVIAYCETHAARFGGAILCMDCQKRVGQAKS